MFSKASNKRSLLSYSENAAFKTSIALKIATHIKKPINVRLSGKNPSLNKWLLENLSAIPPIHITLATGRPSAQRIAKFNPKEAKYE